MCGPAAPLVIVGLDPTISHGALSAPLLVIAGPDPAISF